MKQVKATIQAAPDFDAYAGIVHDKQCCAVNFAYENKTLLLRLLGERVEDASMEIRFNGVLGYEMTSCDFWGPSPHVFGWSLIPDNERTLLPRYLAEAEEHGLDQTSIQRNREYMEIEVQFTSGDTLTVLCCSIDIQKLIMKSALTDIKNAPVFEETANKILTHIDEYYVSELILPVGEKSLWQRCAFIISKMPIDFIAEHAVELMEWFQDLNWPGVDEIFTALSRLPEDELAVALNKSLKTARNTQDEEWDYNLHLKFDKGLIIEP